MFRGIISQISGLTNGSTLIMINMNQSGVHLAWVAQVTANEPRHGHFIKNGTSQRAR